MRCTFVEYDSLTRRRGGLARRAAGTQGNDQKPDSSGFLIFAVFVADAVSLSQIGSVDYRCRCSEKNDPDRADGNIPFQRVAEQPHEHDTVQVGAENSQGTAKATNEDIDPRPPFLSSQPGQIDQQNHQGAQEIPTTCDSCRHIASDIAVIHECRHPHKAEQMNSSENSSGEHQHCKDMRPLFSVLVHRHGPAEEMSAMLCAPDTVSFARQRRAEAGTFGGGSRWHHTNLGLEIEYAVPRFPHKARIVQEYTTPAIGRSTSTIVTGRSLDPLSSTPSSHCSLQLSRRIVARLLGLVKWPGAKRPLHLQGNGTVSGTFLRRELQ